MTDFIEQLQELNACEEAIEYVKGFDSLDEAWQTCERGDWMLWLCGRLAGKPMSDSRRPLALACAKCARLVLHLNDDPGVLACIELVESFGNGDDVSHEAMFTAAADAADATCTAACIATCTASYTATYATYAARPTALRQCADIVREFYPHAPELPNA